MSDDKIHLLPPVETDKLRASIEQIRRNMETHRDYIKLTAELTRARYDAYVESGFTAQEALHLISSGR